MMLFNYLVVSLLLFVIGIVGVLLNRKNLIVLLMSIEIILLSINTNLISFSSYHNDIDGQVFVFFVLTVAAAEMAIGLAMLILIFRNYNDIDFNQINHLKG
ncbi:NADH-quinone oxidoreductase subunit 11 [Candidatus Kinetoplastibacterium sorsogonicusi]|uniref:NADH-quinone oxidoreductase subunit K n=1 Tax=Candidatus Kinetoplastidibacterium kentomonadis TaxID=1576550 RepID=A0A3S7JAA6_9PROT|nr:NADH-quinone oxidoreductase subunit NuoK [Candidatus Kinetoplastibacterium sorsogonicusi]AWD32586.1 NADH-quinone oxidoreductase subunit 11 [Candidatus Kinetoplastibacterium sorsogonicusi]